jgi:hypothetical protein
MRNLDRHNKKVIMRWYFKNKITGEQAEFLIRELHLIEA